MAGRWRFPRRGLGETWPLRLLDVDFFGRFTSYRHVGVFPEQIVHWSWAADRIRARGGRPKVLNLFGYTGVASLVAASAGAEVTHVDASKKAIGWGRENQVLARLASMGCPVVAWRGPGTVDEVLRRLARRAQLPQVRVR